jgi:hypothetical protein
MTNFATCFTRQYQNFDKQTMAKACRPTLPDSPLLEVLSATQSVLFLMLRFRKKN